MFRGRFWPACSAVALLAALVLAGAGLLAQQRSSRDDLLDRFAARGDLAAGFVEAFGQDLLDRERVAATEVLSGTEPSESAFVDLVRAFGFSAAVLLDDRGRALEIYPAARAKLGQDLTPAYAHLASAVRGTPAISDTVGNAAGGQSVVAFATPYETPAGRRVFSGAYAIGTTPLSAYLDHVLIIPGSRVLLLDGAGRVLAGRTPGVGTSGSLTERDPELARALADRSSGAYEQSQVRQRFSTDPVAGTSWRTVVVAPEDGLLAPVRGPIQWVPWALLVVLGLLAAVALRVAWWLVAGRGHLQSANAELDRLAHADPLTGLSNRRHIEGVLRDLVRTGEPVSVLMIDVDHFKRVNDTFGHAAGDRALAHVAEVMRFTLRTHDELGRWGGEEFLAVLPETPLVDAERTGQRLLKALEAHGIALTPTDELFLTASIGAAEARPGELVDVAVLRADRALYRAKQLGRARVLAAHEADPR